MEEYMKICESRRATNDIVQLNFSRKRKLCREVENDWCSDVEFPENAVSAAAAAFWTSGKYECGESTEVGTRRLSSPDLKEVDLQSSDAFGTDISMSINGYVREGTAESELCGDPEQATLMDSSSAPRKPSPPPACLRTNIPASVAKTPSAAELEEFFIAAETYDQKRFSEKYNYDIAKDVPVEGRYQWVRLHP